MISFPLTTHFKLAINSYLIMHTLQNQLMHHKQKFNTILQSCNSRKLLHFYIGNIIFNEMFHLLAYVMRMMDSQLFLYCHIVQSILIMKSKQQVQEIEIYTNNFQ
jgi:hypothetical protein